MLNQNSGPHMMPVLPWILLSENLWKEGQLIQKKFVLPKAVYLEEKEQMLKWSTETDAGNIGKIS